MRNRRLIYRTYCALVGMVYRRGSTTTCYVQSHLFLLFNEFLNYLGFMLLDTARHDATTTTHQIQWLIHKQNLRPGNYVGSLYLSDIPMVGQNWPEMLRILVIFILSIYTL